jgi:hypothetical protein
MSKIHEGAWFIVEKVACPFEINNMDFIIWLNIGKFSQGEVFGKIPQRSAAPPWSPLLEVICRRLNHM